MEFTSPLSLSPLSLFPPLRLLRAKINTGKNVTLLSSSSSSSCFFLLYDIYMRFRYRRAYRYVPKWTMELDATVFGGEWSRIYTYICSTRVIVYENRLHIYAHRANWLWAQASCCLLPWIGPIAHKKSRSICLHFTFTTFVIIERFVNSYDSNISAINITEFL